MRLPPKCVIFTALAISNETTILDGLFMRRVLISLCLLQLCLFVSATLHANTLPNPVVLDTQQDQHNLSDRFSYLDGNAVTTIQEAMQRPSSEWQANKRDPVHLGINTSAWLKVPLQVNASSSLEWILELGWPNLSSVSWYLQDTQTGSLITQQHPATSVANDRLSFPIQLPAEGRYHLYLSVSAAEKLVLPITLLTPEKHNMSNHIRTLCTGLFYGMLLAMLGYNFSLYIFIKDSNYAYYCLYVISIIYYTLSSSSSYITFLWQDASWLNDHSYRVSVPLAFLMASIFIRKFLSIESHGGIVLKLSNIAIATWLLLLLANFFLPAVPHIKLIEISAYISSLLGLAISSYIWYLGNPSGKYMTISWSPLMIVTFFLMLGVTDFIPFSMNLYYLQNITFAVEVLLLSIALAERINREKADKAAAQAKSIYYEQLSVEAKHRELTAQQHALNVEREAREQLEHKVDEQTRELKCAMAALSQVNTELQKASNTDGLTGLDNRRCFDEKFNQAFTEAIAKSQPIAVMIMDIDFFKKVNDQYGHQAGDECLRQIANILTQSANQPHAICARYGGEEFCLVLPNQDPAYALDIAEKLKNNIANAEIHYAEQNFHVTTSIGVYTATPEHIEQRDKFLKYADQALYQAKNNGRNRVVHNQQPDLA